jgi:hypothetical protein
VSRILHLRVAGLSVCGIAWNIDQFRNLSESFPNAAAAPLLL